MSAMSASAERCQQGNTTGQGVEHYRSRAVARNVRELVIVGQKWPIVLRAAFAFFASL